MYLNIVVIMLKKVFPTTYSTFVGKSLKLELSIKVQVYKLSGVILSDFINE